MTWIVELSGDQHTLRQLKDGFRGEVPVLLVDGQYQLDPALFAQSGDYETVSTIAHREVDFLNGYIRIFLYGRQRVVVGNISRRLPGQPKVHYASVEERLVVSAQLVGFTLGGDEAVILGQEHGSGFNAWRALVQKDPVVADILKYVQGSLDDWTNLARIIEAIEHDVGKRVDLVATGWVDGPLLKAFYAAANNPLVAGVTTRHGARKFEAPRSPMEIGDARQLVLNVLQKWIATRTSAAAGGK